MTVWPVLTVAATLTLAGIYVCAQVIVIIVVIVVIAGRGASRTPLAFRPTTVIAATGLTDTLWDAHRLGRIAGCILVFPATTIVRGDDRTRIRSLIIRYSRVSNGSLVRRLLCYRHGAVVGTTAQQCSQSQCQKNPHLSPSFCLQLVDNVCRCRIREEDLCLFLRTVSLVDVPEEMCLEFPPNIHAFI